MNRMGYLGSSDAPVVLGLSPWKTPLALWMEKTGKVKTPDEPSIQMRAGTMLEPLVIALLEENMNLKVGHRQAEFAAPGYPWLQAHLDGIVEGENRAIVEAKTTGSGEGWGEEFTDEIPNHYLVQILSQMISSGLNLCFLPVLIGRNDFRIYTVKKDQAAADSILQKLVEFWELVERDIPPDPVSSSDVVLLYPKSKEREILASRKIEEIVEDYRLVKISMKEDERLLEEFSEKIKLALGEADTLVDLLGNKLCTWKTQERTNIDALALKDFHPDLYRQYLRTTTSRVLRLTKKGA